MRKLRPAKEVAKFLLESAEDLLKTEDDGGCCSLFPDPYDHTLSLSVGWMPGYDKDPGVDYASKKDPTWRINAAIVKYNPADCCDLQFMDQPWNPETGEVWDTMSTLHYGTEGSKLQLAQWYLKEYRAITRALKKGEIRI